MVGGAGKAGAEGQKASRSRDRRWNYINLGTTSQLAGIIPQLVSITVEESRSHWILRGKMRN
jgi:hypothetical protein